MQATRLTALQPYLEERANRIDASCGAWNFAAEPPKLGRCFRRVDRTSASARSAKVHVQPVSASNRGVTAAAEERHFRDMAVRYARRKA